MAWTGPGRVLDRLRVLRQQVALWRERVASSNDGLGLGDYRYTTGANGLGLGEYTYASGANGKRIAQRLIWNSLNGG